MRAAATRGAGNPAGLAHGATAKRLNRLHRGMEPSWRKHLNRKV